MVCEACMNKAPFLWTYAEHFAGNPLFCPACLENQVKLRSLNPVSSFSFVLVPPEIGVERRDHNPVQNLREQNDTETSRNEEQSKQEVRSCPVLD